MSKCRAKPIQISQKLHQSMFKDKLKNKTLIIYANRSLVLESQLIFLNLI